MLYLAYGSNTNFEQMAQRCPGAKMVGLVDLDGYRLAYRRGFLTLLADNERKTVCSVWDINDKHLANLDMYEGYPTFYDKKTISLDFSNGTKAEGLVYIMQPTFNADYGLPTKQYVVGCMQGYNDCAMEAKQLNDALDEVIEQNRLHPTLEIYHTTRRDENFQKLSAKLEDELDVSATEAGIKRTIKTKGLHYLDDKSQVFIAYLGSEPVGCVAFREHEKGTAELKRLYVVPDYRKKGIGRELVQTAENEARYSGYHTMLLQTTERARDALSIYKCRGYEECPLFEPYLKYTKSICMKKVIVPIMVKGFSPYQDDVDSFFSPQCNTISSTEVTAQDKGYSKSEVHLIENPQELLAHLYNTNNSIVLTEFGAFEREIVDFIQSLCRDIGINETAFEMDKGGKTQHRSLTRTSQNGKFSISTSQVAAPSRLETTIVINNEFPLIDTHTTLKLEASLNHFPDTFESFIHPPCFDIEINNCIIPKIIGAREAKTFKISFGEEIEPFVITDAKGRKTPAAALPIIKPIFKMAKSEVSRALREMGKGYSTVNMDYYEKKNKEWHSRNSNNGELK